MTAIPRFGGWASSKALQTFTALAAIGAAAACGDVQTDLIVREPPAAGVCRSDEDCSGDAPRCETATNHCVECLETRDCAEAQVCALPAARCVSGCVVAGCSQDAPVCETSGVCRGCETDDECAGDTPRCNTEGTCVACLDASDCTDSEEPFCSPSGRCAECISDGHCDDADERCSAVLGECATPCETEGAGSACSFDDPICDPDIGFCVECRSDDDCDSDERCLASECEDAEEEEDD